MRQAWAFTSEINHSEAVAVEVSDGKGRWWSGYWILTFDADGLATVLSAATGGIQRLPQDRWRDPIEEKLLTAERALLRVEGETGRIPVSGWAAAGHPAQILAAACAILRSDRHSLVHQ
ncbi:MAG: hypothetical protein VKI42_00210 [Synechococcaceae cyanobacterium]|nr:hypothetical protein [Synechococcaceae cyanobacterium]